MPQERDAEQVMEALRAEHRALEMRLAELDGHKYLTPSEQVERAELKKLKLAKKDAIERIARGHRATA
jgi:uncharacterized protein YdcH (DUF465 family)